MRYQDYMCDVTKRAAAEAFRYAKAVPAEKLDWKPMEEGQSVLSQARELAQTPVWAQQVITRSGPPEFSEENRAAERAEMAKMVTIEQCEATCNANLEDLFKLYRSLSDEKLKETKWLPFDGGRDFTIEEMLDYPRWNFNYHLGQIAYIQTLYGDRDMH